MQIIQFVQSWEYNNHTVSSEHMACNWVPNITKVNIAKSNASNPKNIKNTTVAGGVYQEHCFHSECKHQTNWLTHKYNACNDIAAM